MPLTKKGEEILAAMKNEYGANKGEKVFYASRNAGKIGGVDRADMAPADFDQLRALFSEFMEEEAEEPEHRLRTAADSLKARARK